MKKRLVLIVLAALLSTATVRAFWPDEGDATGYRLVTVERGDLEAVVSSTGTLEATTTVQVGTQVSGTISAIYADFNEDVRAGQAVALIDPTLLASAVRIAAAELERAVAELEHAEREMMRVTALEARELVSVASLNEQQYQRDVAQANVTGAAASLERAEKNLEFATIEAPISGTVIERNVDVGQTVAASLSAPQLFLIAKDLSAMQILVAVDESDIGRIVEGQTARFTVQAYPDDLFTGTVRQVRLQSSYEENVVNYTAVVDVANPDGILLPGMTATVDFVVETATDVLYVANASLRYRPDEETMSAAFERLHSERTASQGDGAFAPSSAASSADGARDESRAFLWTLDASGQPSPIPVRTGISDGTNTVVLGGTLESEQQVIAGVASSSAVASSTNSPFQQERGGERSAGPPTPGGF